MIGGPLARPGICGGIGVGYAAGAPLPYGGPWDGPPLAYGAAAAAPEPR